MLSRNHMTHRRISYLLLLTLALSARFAKADWHAYVLDTSANDSGAADADGTRILGTRGTEAGSWTVGGPFVSYHPANALLSRMAAISAGRGGGTILTNNSEWHAGVWNLADQSFTDVHPGNRLTSEILCIAPTFAAGQASDNDGQRAALWQYAAGSWEFNDKHPAGFRESSIWETDGVALVGYGRRNLSTRNEGLYWESASGDPISLNVSDLQQSMLMSTSAGIQVGVGFDTFDQFHAIRWAGTSESATYLPDDGALSSLAYFNIGEDIAGEIWYDGNPLNSQAVMWQGPAHTLLNLHDLVPSQYTSSIAGRFRRFGNQLFVTGMVREANGQQHAAVWVNTVPEPGTWAILTLGSLSLLRRRRQR